VLRDEGGERVRIERGGRGREDFDGVETQRGGLRAAVGEASLKHKRSGLGFGHEGKRDGGLHGIRTGR